MKLPKFEYREPADLKEACSILADEPGSRVLAGGTDLLVNMKHRAETPAVLVNLKRIAGLSYIREADGALRIGALTPLKRVHQAPVVAEAAPALAAAAAAVGSYHHQSMGTVGGSVCQQNRCRFFNQSRSWRSARPTCFKAGGEICHVVNQPGVCWSTYCGDLAPALLVLGARVRLAGRDDSREVLLESLFSGDGKTPLALEKGEILTELSLPAESRQGFSNYLKFANRGSIDFPIVGAALWTSRESGVCRLAFTAVDRRPPRARQLEEALQGRALSPELAEEAAGLAPKAAKVVKTSIHSPGYKRTLMELLARELLNEAMGREKA